MHLVLETMIETKFAVLRVDVLKETGEVMLLMETACGFRPVMGWPNLYGFQEFTDTRVGICSRISYKEVSNDKKCSDEV